MDITVHNAELVEQNGVRAWMFALEVTKPDGTTEMHASVVPADTLEWRVAEYDLDDMADDEVWELILREPFSDLDVMDPTSLFNADSIAEARGAYLGKIREKKGTGKLRKVARAKRALQPDGKPLKAAGPKATVLIDTDGGDALAALKQHTPRRDEHVKARRVITRQAREDHRRARAGQAPHDDVVLAEAEKIRRRASTR